MMIRSSSLLRGAGRDAAGRRRHHESSGHGTQCHVESD